MTPLMASDTTIRNDVLQMKPWDEQFMNALFNSMIDWEATLQPYRGKIKNRDTALQ